MVGATASYQHSRKALQVRSTPSHSNKMLCMTGEILLLRKWSFDMLDQRCSTSNLLLELWSNCQLLDWFSQLICAISLVDPLPGHYLRDQEVDGQEKAFAPGGPPLPLHSGRDRHSNKDRGRRDRLNWESQIKSLCSKRSMRLAKSREWNREYGQKDDKIQDSMRRHLDGR